MHLNISWGDSVTSVEVDENLELSDLQALLEVETDIQIPNQVILYSGNQLQDGSKSLSSFGLKNDDLLLVTSKPAASTSQPNNALDPNIEAQRRHIISQPHLLAEIRAKAPEMAQAAQNDPPRFHQLWQRMMQQLQQQQQPSGPDLEGLDEMDPRAQEKIAEFIRKQQVEENLANAMEYTPEAFARVTMLYVDIEVNGHKIKAFVDSGAQATIMSPSCAEACGIMRLLDTNFAGIARGVGTAKILGRIHSAQMKVGKDLFLPCSFTVMEGRDVDLLFGLDMLKRHQAVIDLHKNALIIQGREVPFLPEHECPKGTFDVEVDENGNVIMPPASDPHVPAAAGAAASASTEAIGTKLAAQFPGSGQTLGSSSTQQQPPTESTSRHPESAIQSLIGFGVPRTQAIEMLDFTNGNVEEAASMLFG